jgi:hypothetical protein
LTLAGDPLPKLSKHETTPLRAGRELKALLRQSQKTLRTWNPGLDLRRNQSCENAMRDRDSWAAIVTLPGQEFLACQEISRFCLTCFLPQRRRRIFGRTGHVRDAAYPPPCAYAAQSGA